MNGVHTGKNLLKLNDGTYTYAAGNLSVVISNGIASIIGTMGASGGRTTRLSNVFLLKAGDYFISPRGSDYSPYVRVFINKASDNTSLGYNSGSKITIAEDVEVYVGFSFAENGVYNVTDFAPMIEVGSSVSSYEPFSAETKKWSFPPFGKNLLNDAGQGTGTIWYYYNDGILLEKDKAYTFSCGNRGSGSISFYGIDHTTQLSYAYIDNSSASVTFTPTEDMRVCPKIYQVGLTPSDVINPQLEQSSTATAYEPYQSMFSGQVNALTGEVESNNKFLVLTSANASLITRTNANKYRVSQAGTGAKISGADYAGVICNVCKPETGTTNDDRCFIRSDGIIQLNFTNSYNSVSEMLADVGDIQLCYEMEDPISIDMDSVDWQSKKGDNNLYCDTGDTTCEYYKDGYGYTSVTVNRTGKNLTSHTTDFTSTANVNVQQLIFGIDLKGGITYTASCKQSVSVSTSDRNTLGVRPQGGTITWENTTSNFNPTNLRHTLTFTPSTSGRYEIIFWANKPTISATYNEWQLEIGSSASAYVPYETPVTKTAKLHKVIYGGEVDVIKGTAKPKNLISPPEYTANTPTLCLDLGEDKTFDSVTLSFLATNTVVNSNVAAIVDYRKNDGTHQYRTLANFKNENGVAFAAQTPNSGRFRNSYISVSGITFRYVYIYYEYNTYSFISTDSMSEWQLELGSSASDYVPHFEPFTFTPISMETVEGTNVLYANEGDSTVTYRRSAE